MKEVDKKCHEKEWGVGDCMNVKKSIEHTEYKITIIIQLQKKYLS